MKLNITVKTNLPDVIVDYIEVQLASGEQVSLNWDQSEIYRTEEGFEACYIGVCFHENPADGRIDELVGMTIVDIGLYSESSDCVFFDIEEMEFEEFGRFLSFVQPPVPIEFGGAGEMSLLQTDSTKLAGRLVAFCKDFSYYDYLDSLDPGKTDEDAIRQMELDLSSNKNVILLLDNLKEISSDDDLRIEQKREVDSLISDLSGYLKPVPGKVSLSDQIKRASFRVTESDPLFDSKEKGYNSDR